MPFSYTSSAANPDKNISGVSPQRYDCTSKNLSQDVFQKKNHISSNDPMLDHLGKIAYISTDRIVPIEFAGDQESKQVVVESSPQCQHYQVPNEASSMIHQANHGWNNTHNESPDDKNIHKSCYNSSYNYDIKDTGGVSNNSLHVVRGYPVAIGRNPAASSGALLTSSTYQDYYTTSTRVNYGGCQQNQVEEHRSVTELENFDPNCMLVTENHIDNTVDEHQGGGHHHDHPKKYFCSTGRPQNKMQEPYYLGRTTQKIKENAENYNCRKIVHDNNPTSRTPTSSCITFSLALWAIVCLLGFECGATFFDKSVQEWFIVQCLGAEIVQVRPWLPGWVPGTLIIFGFLNVLLVGLVWLCASDGTLDRAGTTGRVAQRLNVAARKRCPAGSSCHRGWYSSLRKYFGVYLILGSMLLLLFAVLMPGHDSLWLAIVIAALQKAFGLIYLVAHDESHLQNTDDAEDDSGVDTAKQFCTSDTDG